MEINDLDARRLMSLPGEIPFRVLTSLDDSDIPNVKLTCKTLYSITMTRQFWYNCIHRLCKEYLVSPPEEQLHEYTVVELQQWTLRRIRCRSTGPTKLRIRIRHVKWSYLSRRLILLPGGRWLLNIYPDLPVFFIDLDSSDLERHLLFDPRCVDPRRISNGPAIRDLIWIDHRAPRLSFRFAFYFPDKDEENGLKSLWVYICQVSLIGHGTDATLATEPIASFRTPKQDEFISAGTLNNRYFVQIRQAQPESKDIVIEILDYRSALGRRDYPLLEPHAFSYQKDFRHLRFLNEDVFSVFCQESSSYHIFNIESLTSLKFLHKTNLDIDWRDCSQVRWTPEASLMTWIGDQNDDKPEMLYGLIIPHDTSIRPWPVEIGTSVRITGEHLKLGIFNSLSCDFISEISRFHHEWDYTSSRGEQSHNITTLKQSMEYPKQLVAFDEDTGRSVYVTPDQMQIGILFLLFFFCVKTFVQPQMLEYSVINGSACKNTEDFVVRWEWGTPGT